MITTNNSDDLSERIAAWLSESYSERTSFWSFERSLGATLGTARGSVRSENQDRVLCARYTPRKNRGEPWTLFALADGMGGMQEGAKCAEIALSVIVKTFLESENGPLQDKVARSVVAANRRLYELYKNRGGTTLSAIILAAGEVCLVNVGDSRIYTFQSGASQVGEGRFRQVTTDDTIAGELERLKGVRLPDSHREHLSNQLAQYLGLGDGLEPHFYGPKEISAEDGYLITSDGAHDLALETFARLVLTSPTGADTVKRVLQVATWIGGFDNASVICIEPGSLTNFGVGRQNYAGILALWNGDSRFEILLESKTDPNSALPEGPLSLAARQVKKGKKKLRRIDNQHRGLNLRGTKDGDDEPPLDVNKYRPADGDQHDGKSNERQCELNIQIGLDDEHPENEKSEKPEKSE